MEAIEKIIKELEFSSKKDFNTYLKLNIGFLEEDFKYIKENINIDDVYLKKKKIP